VTRAGGRRDLLAMAWRTGVLLHEARGLPLTMPETMPATSGLMSFSFGWESNDGFVSFTETDGDEPLAAGGSLAPPPGCSLKPLPQIVSPRRRA